VGIKMIIKIKDEWRGFGQVKIKKGTTQQMIEE
jgi:hypothetical protein